jgi:hypothetical protein
MDGDFSPQYKPSQRADFLLSIPAVDTNTACLETRLFASRERRDAGFLMQIGSQQRSSSIPHTIWMRRQARNVQRIGLAIKCISPQTCDEDLPRLITQVTTTIAPTPARQALPEIHEVLDQREALPEQQRARCRIYGC